MDRRVVRFGVFELDRTAGELRRGGVRIRVQEQPLRILLELLAQPGEIVTRDDLRTRIWGDTFVDYDRALNTAIKKLRSALGDSADTPRFIETVARRGYRFIAPLRDEVAPPVVPRASRRVPVLIAAIALAVVAIVAGFLLLRKPTRRIDSLAVLPFVNLTGAAANEYVCDGLTETLISDLGHVRALRVISRTTAMQYKNAKKPLPRIASELGVEGIVEGAVLRFGDRVRVNVKLVDASRDTLLWSSRYERNASDLDALRRELAVAVAAQFGARFDPSGWRAPDPEAQLLYLKGRYWLSEKRNGAVAAQLFRQALAKDPAYAAPYAGLTEVEMFAPNVAPRDALLRARAFAEKAIALDASVADAHASLGMVRMFLERDFASAEREFRRAIELKPGAVEAHHRYGQLLAALGRFDESIAESRRASELDPFSTLVIADYGRALYFARRYDDAVAQYRRVLAIDPDDKLAFWFLLQAYEAQKKYDLIVAGLRTTINPDRRAALDEAYRKGGFGIVARTWAEIVARDQENAPFVRTVSVAARFAQAGDRERSFAWLDRAYQSHTRDLVYLAVEPAFDPIRGDPRFAAMLKKIGLATSSSAR